MTNATILSISDLNSQDFDEPRILDVKLGFSLGMKNPTSAMRQMIKRNITELEGFGEVFARNAKTSKKGGRPSMAYWLTEGQALCLAALSNAPKAPDARKMLIEVFMAYRRGQLAAQTIPAIPAPDKAKPADPIQELQQLKWAMINATTDLMTFANRIMEENDRLKAETKVLDDMRRLLQPGPQ